MAKDSKQRIFSCPECGNPYVAFPPDDIHDVATIKEPSMVEARSVVKIIHDCEHCKTPITVYWYKRRLDVSVG